jgi:GGDEF domain-containing protein
MAQYVPGPETQLSIEQEKNELLRRADAAMYRAKSLGGNRVVLSGASEHVGQVL